MSIFLVTPQYHVTVYGNSSWLLNKNFSRRQLSEKFPKSVGILSLISLFRMKIQLMFWLKKLEIIRTSFPLIKPLRSRARRIHFKENTRKGLLNSKKMKCQEWCFGRKMSLVKSKYEPPLSDYQSLTSDFQLALEFWVPRVFSQHVVLICNMMFGIKFSLNR